jgi:hypothetical protein
MVCLSVSCCTTDTLQNTIYGNQLVQSVIFIKQKDAFVATNIWEIVNLDLVPYEKTVMNVKADVEHVKKFKYRLAPVNELVQIDKFLRLLQRDIEAFNPCYPTETESDLY